MKIDDINSISEALKSRKLNKLYVKKYIQNPRIKEIEKEANRKGIPVKYISGKERILGDVSPVQYSEFDALLNRCLKDNSFLMFLDSVEDPQNLGAVIRSASFFGCSGVVIPKRRAVQITDTVLKVSSGAVFHIGVARTGNFASHLKKAKKRGLSVIGAEIGGENLSNAGLFTPTALIVGGEDKGLSNPVKKQCDEIVEIPGFGEIKSLNLAASAAIIMYELRRSNDAG